MKEKSKSEVSIIGGADGPTSIFIAGRTRKKPLKVRIRNIIYRYRRKIVEKKVVADSHTLDELVQYAMNTYNLIDLLGYYHPPQIINSSDNTCSFHIKIPPLTVLTDSGNSIC